MDTMGAKVNNERKIISPLIKHKYMVTFGAIIAAIVIIALLFTAGHLPNTNTIGSTFNPLPVYKSGQGALNGYIAGPLGLPAVGATVVAAEQGGAGITKTAFVSVDGKYVFNNLEPGKYLISVGFPDGANRIINNINVDPNSVDTVNLKY